MRLWDLAASLAAGRSDEVGASWGRTVVLMKPVVWIDGGLGEFPVAGG